MRALSTSVDSQLSYTLVMKETKKLKESASSSVNSSVHKNLMSEPTVSFTDADFEKLISEI